MSQYPHLSNAPIKEAIIDIRISSEPYIKIERIERILDLLPESYSEKRPIFSGGVSFKIDDHANTTVEDNQSTHIGYRADNQQDNYVVQIRNNGFTLSKLPPYDSFEHFKNEAIGLWSIVKAELKNFRKERVAVRFINEIILPFKDSKLDFDEYLVNGPRPPKHMGEIVSSFFERLEIPDFETNSTTFVTQAVKKVIYEGAPLILDIDSFRADVSSFSDNEMWSYLEKLRELKNRAFFGSLTPKALELFK